MANGQTNLTNVAGILKRIQEGGVVRQQNLAHRAIDEIQKSSKKYSSAGAGFFGAINDYGNESVGAINETESFRSIDNEDYQQYKVVPKILVAPISFSGLAAEAANGDEESYADAILDALDAAQERGMKDQNRQFYGLGTGALCSPNASVASNLTSFTVDSAQYLRKNMVLDAFTGSTKTVTAIRVSNVDKINSIVYFSTSLGAALTTTDVFVKQNVRDSQPSDGKEMMGLRGIIDDGTDLTTFQNLNASTLLEWQAIRINASSANLTSDLLQRLEDDVSVLGGEDIDRLIMHPKQRRKYLDIVVPQKRYADGEMDAGFKKLSFNGMELWLDVDCQSDTVYGIKRSRLKRFEILPWSVGRKDGSDMFLRISGSDTFEAYYRTYTNMGTDKRNSHGKIVSLAKPNGVA